MKKNKKIENNFSAVDFSLSIVAALDFDKKNSHKTDIQKFADNFKTIYQVMDEGNKNKKGYY